MAIQYIYPTFPLNASGQTISIPVAEQSAFYLITGTVSLGGAGTSNIFQESGTPTSGLTYIYKYRGAATYGGVGTVSFHGVDLPADLADQHVTIYAQYDGSAWNVDFIIDWDGTTKITNSQIDINTIELTKLANGTSAQIQVANGSGVWSAVSVTGDVTITNAGVTAIAAGVIVDADINASAAITRTKLANGTADHVIINNGSGTLSSEAQLDPSRGGTGQDFSSSTGIVKVSAGTFSVGSTISNNEVAANTLQPSKLTAVHRTLREYISASFESGEKGTNYHYMPYKGTIDEIKIRVTKLIEATDDGTVEFQDDSGNSMGTVTITKASAYGTGFSLTPASNNTFNPGDEIRVITTKTTAGGKLDITFETERNDT